MRARTEVIVRAIGVIAVGIALGLAYGSEFGTGNQHTYLLDPLVHAYPELYRNDWFVTANHHYHVVFATVTAPLFSIDADGTRAFGVAQLVVAVATFAAIYPLIAAVTQKGRFVVFTGLCGLVVLGGDHALGGSYLYASYLQPSSLAVVAWLVALGAWIRGRTLLAGIALGIGAAFHLNYALLGIGLFGLAQLSSDRRDWRSLAIVVTPSLLVLIAFMPTMLASSATKDNALAMRVLTEFLFPGHFKPLQVFREIAGLLGWFVLLVLLRPAERAGAPDRMFRFGIVTMGVTIAVALLVFIPPLLPLTRLFVWRVVPFGILCAQIVFFVEVGKIAAGDRPRPRGLHAIGILVAAAGIAANAFYHRRAPAYPEVIAAVMVACTIAVVARRQVLVLATCGALCLVSLWIQRTALVSPILFSRKQTRVAEWARTTTPRDALFLVPPYESKFRLTARRAVVVDFKSPPMYMDEIVAWYRRVCTVVDAPSVASIPAARAKWDALRPEQLVAIAHTFDVDYVLLDKSRSAARLALPVAYEDEVDIVYEIR